MLECKRIVARILQLGLPSTSLINAALDPHPPILALAASLHRCDRTNADTCPSFAARYYALRQQEILLIFARGSPAPNAYFRALLSAPTIGAFALPRSAL
jgi:hypothetical protein